MKTLLDITYYVLTGSGFIFFFAVVASSFTTANNLLLGWQFWVIFVAIAGTALYVDTLRKEY